jgi:hypothetical protein
MKAAEAGALIMRCEPPVVVVLVKPNTSPRKTARLLRWLRWLLPTALLVVSQAPTTLTDLDDVVTLGADAVDSSALAVADAIVNAREGR